MYYYKARIYSPSLGRFMQTDPIGYEDGMNMYAYVANDPVNRTDPTGEAGSCEMCWSDLAMSGMNDEQIKGIQEAWAPYSAAAAKGVAIGASLAIGPEVAEASLARVGVSYLVSRGVVVHSGVLGRGLLAGGNRFLTAGINTLQNAASVKGNFGLGRATASAADRLGRTWVGKGARQMSNGKGWVSRDGLRAYRGPSTKANGQTQANFERYQKVERDGQEVIEKVGNGHLEIR